MNIVDRGEWKILAHFAAGSRVGAMLANVHPGSGGRVICDLVSCDGATVIYEVALYTAVQVWRGQAQVAPTTGVVSCSRWDIAEAPAWLVTYAEAFLRSEWRAHARDPAAPWANRIARWRAGGGQAG